MTDNDKLYDEIILPLTQEIFDLCVKHAIPFQMNFLLSDTLVRGCRWIPAGEEIDDRLRIAARIFEMEAPFVVAAPAVRGNGRRTHD